MATFIIKDDEQLGPYEDSFVFTKLKSGEFSYDDFCWREGMEEWKPLRTIFEPPLSVPPKFSKKTASKAVTTKTEPEPHSKQYGKGSLFLGLYIPKGLKLKVAAASKKEGRSMSNFATRVFEEYFSKTKKTEPEPHSKQYGKGSLFLGLYFPKELKLKVAAAAKKEGRSMSNFATRVFEEYFSKTKD